MEDIVSKKVSILPFAMQMQVSFLFRSNALIESNLPVEAVCLTARRDSDKYVTAVLY